MTDDLKVLQPVDAKLQKELERYALAAAIMAVRDLTMDSSRAEITRAVLQAYGNVTATIRSFKTEHPIEDHNYWVGPDEHHVVGTALYGTLNNEDDWDRVDAQAKYGAAFVGFAAAAVILDHVSQIECLCGDLDLYGGDCSENAIALFDKHHVQDSPDEQDDAL